MQEENRKRKLVKALAKAPPEVKRLLKESELIMGGLLKASGEAGDVIVKSKGKNLNARWIGRKVKTRKVSEAEMHGMTRAFREIKQKKIDKVALVIQPQKPPKPPKTALKTRAG